METDIMNEILTVTVSKLFLQVSDKSMGSELQSKLGSSIGSTAGHNIIEEMKNKYTYEEDEKKIEDDLKPGYAFFLISGDDFTL